MMKQLAKKMLLVSTMVAASSSFAGNLFDFDCVSPYVGIDYYNRWMSSVDAGDIGLTNAAATNFNNVRPRNTYPGLSLYAGARWDCIGFEVGYDASFQNRRSWTVAGVSGRTTSQVHGGHIDLLAFVPVMDCAEFVLGAGIGFMQPRLRFETTNQANNLTSNYSGRTSGVGRVRAGFNYMFTDCIGARFLLGYETTSALRVKVPSNPVNTALGRANATVKPYNDSFTLALGLFYKF